MFLTDIGQCRWSRALRPQQSQACRRDCSFIALKRQLLVIAYLVQIEIRTLLTSRLTSGTLGGTLGSSVCCLNTRGPFHVRQHYLHMDGRKNKDHADFKCFNRHLSVVCCFQILFYVTNLSFQSPLQSLLYRAPLQSLCYAKGCTTFQPVSALWMLVLRSQRWLVEQPQHVCGGTRKPNTFLETRMFGSHQRSWAMVR